MNQVISDKIALYGRFPSAGPAEISALVEQYQRKREPSREHYPILPWTMDELPGTTWRNPYTAGSVTIHEIRENRAGKPGPDPDPWINAMFAIGLWWGDRFVIDCWVRVDHLSIETQMEWHLALVIYCAGEVGKARRSLEDKKNARADSCHGANVNLRKRDLERTQEQHADAARKAREFATSHGLPVAGWELTDLPLFSYVVN